MTHSKPPQKPRGIGGVIGRALRIGFIPAALGIMLLVLILQNRGDDDARVIKREIYAMGTLITMTAVADPEHRETAQAAISAAAATAQRVQQRWQPQPDPAGGALAQLNADLATDPSARVPADLLPLVTRARELARASAGTFDPGIGALVAAWGFDDPDNFRTEPLPAAQIAAARTKPHQLANTELQEGALLAPAPGLMLDFGAMAKGHAVDQMIDTLRRSGVENALVNAGGDLKVIGTSPRGRTGEGLPWKIAIRHPRPTADDRLLALLELRGGEAAFTSGDYERYFEHGGQRYHHLLDPRTGQPAQSARSATVVAEDAALADAAATALFVGGPDQFAKLTGALGLNRAMLMAADGSVICTPALCDRLQWTTPRVSAPTVVAPAKPGHQQAG